jgi:hypothetical protein
LRDRPKQQKFLGLGLLSRKKWFIELTLGGGFSIVNRHRSLTANGTELTSKYYTVFNKE